MANVAANVRVGVTGSVFQAPSGTSLPGDAITAPGVGFDDLGYVSDAGVTQSINRTTTDIVAWGGDVVRTVQTEHNVTYSFTLIETKAETLALYYSDTDASATAAQITSAQAARGVWIIDVVDGSNVIRLELPDAEITDTGDVTYATEEAIGYECTVTAYPDGSGVKAYQWMATV